MEVWTRPKHRPGGGEGSAVYFVFADDPLDGLRLDRARHGIPDGFSADCLELATLSRDERPDVFEELLAGPVLDRAVDEPGVDVERLRGARFRHSLRVTVPDPSDLAYLQGAWAALRALGEQGAHAAVDAHAIRWIALDARYLPPAGAPFDVRREVSIVFESQASPGYGHVCHTRGLAKFGRQDLVLLGLRPQDAAIASAILASAAKQLASGLQYFPGRRVSFGGAAPRVVVPYEPGANAPDLELNNDALILAPTA